MTFATLAAVCGAILFNSGAIRGKQKVLADFHREFLEEYRERHADYNWNWWLRNAELNLRSGHAAFTRYMLDRKTKQEGNSN